MDKAIQKYTLIQRFMPTEEKVELLADKLLNEPMYISDEWRDSKRIYQLITYYMYASRSVTFELGDYAGILWFVEIIPEYRADIVFKLWDKSLWGPDLARELKAIFPDVMKMFRLKRLALQTPDEAGAKLAKLCGFAIEGRQKFGFRWNGRLMTNIMLRKVSDRK